MSILRSYRREVSRNRMKRDGYAKINKGKKTGSYFSHHWRDFLNMYKKDAV